MIKLELDMAEINLILEAIHLAHPKETSYLVAFKVKSQALAQLPESKAKE